MASCACITRKEAADPLIEIAHCSFVDRKRGRRGWVTCGCSCGFERR